MKAPYSKVHRRLTLVVALLLVIAVSWWVFFSDSRMGLRKGAELIAIEIIGNIATQNMPEDVAGGFHNIPIELRKLSPNIYQVSGISNTHLITTAAGSVLFDTGIAIQAAEQIKILKPWVQGDLTHIILSHSHADHIGGTRFWREANTQIVAHYEYPEEQRYLTELQPYFWHRNRVLFPWLPEQPPQQSMLRYGGITPDIYVDHKDFSFELGGVRFDLLSTPGAEGADNLCLFLPQQKILFSGDFYGPLWPQFPNIFTMRGEKFRKPIEYIQSLNKLIALEPEMIIPSHHTAIRGKGNIKAGMVKIRDAVQYIHDAVIAGMNSGATVQQLMHAITLPPELDLTQEHGKVAWAVKSIWEYYATWFHYDSTTELYAVHARDIYPELAELAGVDMLIDSAQAQFDAQQPIHALHLLEVALASRPGEVAALNLRLKVLNHLLATAQTTTDNNYEKDYLRARIRGTEEQLANQ